ncbi:ABC transporter permease, partial [bacterium]|nr:ABC transporter permease [bacterium]
DESYPSEAMQAAVSVENVRRHFEAILGFGSRFLGQPGFYATEGYIREQFEKAGLEIYQQELRTAVPATLQREISLVQVRPDGSETEIPLPDVEIFPFFPNHLQPQVTPEGGLSGELVRLTSETLRSRKSFTDCIGLIDASEGMADKDYNFDWIRYARLGVKALIVATPEGLDEAPWTRIKARDAGMVSSVPVNYVRLAASEEIFDYLGQRIRLRVKTIFENAPNRTLYGVLRAKEPTKEALLVTSFYDARSLLPDRAPGVLQAIQPALQMALLEGMVPYRDSLRRDVIFVAWSGIMAEDGPNRLLSILSTNQAQGEENPLLAAFGLTGEQTEAEKAESGGRRLEPLVQRQEENDDKIQTARAILEFFEKPAFIHESAGTEALLDGLDTPARKFFDEQFHYVLNALVLKFSEPKLQAKIEFERSLSEDVYGEAFTRYKNALAEYETVASAAGYSVLNLLRQKAVFVQDYEVRRLCKERFDELLAHHEILHRQLSQEIALVRLINRYENIGFFDSKILPPFDTEVKREVLSFETGQYVISPAAVGVMSLLSSARERLGLEDLSLPPLDRWQHRIVGRNIGDSPRQAVRMQTEFGYASYTFLNFERSESYSRYTAPADLPFMHDIETLRLSMAVMGEGILSLAHGNGYLDPTTPRIFKNQTWGGRALVSNVGQSVVPNFPLKNAIIACRSRPGNAQFCWPGYYENLILFADVYGKYYLPHNASDFPAWINVWLESGHTPLAASYDENGLLAYVKDEGEEGQRLYKSARVNWQNPGAIRNVTIVTFRAMPVALLDRINPQTMKDYSSVEFISKDGLTPFRKECLFRDVGIDMAFLEPDQRFYLQLQSGAPGNELAKMTRAFMLGVNDVARLDPNREIDGDGYLVADTAVLLDVPFEVARSMLYVNGKRLDLQNQYGMADEMTNVYHEKSEAYLAASAEPDLSKHESTQLARDAVTYATLNHPVLRESIFEAVLGILWYLALLVPFVFFFEKLVFCFPDVRKQLVAQAVIFLAVFVLLRLLHPAFQMVRSSLMILLGFVIILISGGITILFSGKFQENLEELRRKRGKVAAAEVNTLGVIGSAFMLGLNNMHRRKVRTGLTCATLTLLTFVMICFTSVKNDVVDENVALAKAPYQGLLIKRERFKPLSSSEVFAVQSKYGEDYEICPRQIWVGSENFEESQRYNPQLEATFRSGDVPRRVEFDSILQFTATEPLRDQIRFITEKRWFTEDHELDTDALDPVILPDKMAEALGVTAQAVNEGQPIVTINGRDVFVLGIFDSRHFQNLTDIDGQDLLPFDIESMEQLDREGWLILASDDDPRISAEKLVLAPVKDLHISAENAGIRYSSLVISMRDVSYKDAKITIEDYMEQNAEPVFYGLDGVAYWGRRTRETTLAGLIDLLIPLIIAALTVLNTMRGSVYERRDEIFVYNAVGIAPRYVFFMFFTEAFVYAVVGAVGGYLLSQGTGRILTELGLTGGLNMTFTSVTTIYASLTITLAVFISTYFPARSAMEISAPAEESGWKLPEPVGDELAFDLPFTFTPRDRIAILAFFDRYLRDHGEGSAGRFFAAPPQTGISNETDSLAQGGFIPQIEAMIWLKPFDLGVSQQMIISLPTDPETSEYKARIALRRLSGTRESWLRLNLGFVTLVRRHFLHWRAVHPEERASMFAEAQESLRQSISSLTSQTPVAG